MGRVRTSRLLAAAVAGAALAACGGASGSGVTAAADTLRADPEPERTSECDDWDPAWIWCDDFEVDRSGGYFEFDDRGGSFTRVRGVGREGGTAMRVRFEEGQVAAGSLKLALGVTPGPYFVPADDGVRRYRELYWRFFLLNQPGWTGGGGHKLSRATVFTGEEWSQAMIAHVWSGSHPHERVLVLDPASGMDRLGLRVLTRWYNDFDNLEWLGIARGRTPIFGPEGIGEWHCIETHVRLNEPGRRDGEFRLWIDGEREASRSGLDWVGTYSEYGINAIFLENYWDGGAPQRQKRYIDHFVVSTERIGCLDE